MNERAPVSGVVYFGFVDPSGGSGDSMTLAIGLRQGDVVIIDAVRERRPPFSAEECGRRVRRVAQELPHHGGRDSIEAFMVIAD